MKLRMDEFVRIMSKMTRMEYGFWENATFIDQSGQVFNAISSNSSGLEGIYHEIFEFSKSVVAFILLSIVLAKTNILIPLVEVIAIILTGISDSAYTNYHSSMMPEFNKMDRKLNHINRQATDFSYGKDIRVFKMKGSYKHLVSKLIKEYSRKLKMLRIKKLLTNLPKSLGFSLLSIGIVYLLGLNFNEGEISLANLVMTLSIIAIYVGQVTEIARVIFYVYQESVDLEYYYDFIDAEIDIQGGMDLDIKDIVPEIIFEDVYFKYPNSDTWVLEGLNIKINPNESIALVGVNGAGKTTIVNLITGLFQPNKGRILIGGYDTSSLSQETLNELIAVVLQKFEPLALKVKENVSASINDIDEELVIKSLEKAGLLNKINSFEKGINSTMLRVIKDDGVVLSGGENQKLSIARALYKKESKILILDEPTSALDALAEEEIYREFEEIITGKTGIFISHRLASTRFCDKILLLNRW